MSCLSQTLAKNYIGLPKSAGKVLAYLSELLVALVSGSIAISCPITMYPFMASEECV